MYPTLHGVVLQKAIPVSLRRDGSSVRFACRPGPAARSGDEQRCPFWPHLRPPARAVNGPLGRTCPHPGYRTRSAGRARRSRRRAAERPSSGLLGGGGALQTAHQPLAIASVKMRASSTMSSSEVFSAQWWLTPLILSTNSTAAGITRATCCASWPAPDGIRTASPGAYHRLQPARALPPQACSGSRDRNHGLKHRTRLAGNDARRAGIELHPPASPNRARACGLLEFLVDGCDQPHRLRLCAPPSSWCRRGFDGQSP
jgi:hypothetical protein